MSTLEAVTVGVSWYLPLTDFGAPPISPYQLCAASALPARSAMRKRTRDAAAAAAHATDEHAKRQKQINGGAAVAASQSVAHTAASGAAAAAAASAPVADPMELESLFLDACGCMRSAERA